MALSKNPYYRMRDSLSIIHGVLCLCLDGTLGKMTGEQTAKLKMAEGQIWELYESIGEVMNIDLKRFYKKLKN